jgi:hypothetical protein
MSDRLLTSAQAAEYLGLSPKRFSRFAARLPHMVPGKRTVFGFIRGGGDQEIARIHHGLSQVIAGEAN